MNAGGRDPGATAPPSSGRIVDASKLDLVAAERAALDLLRALGADLERPDVQGTPRRVAASLAELVTPRPTRAKFATISQN
jgi:GTP cyclohydrolase I